MSTIPENSVTITALARSENGADIAQGEWWIGNDPGFGKGNPMTAIDGSFKSPRVDITASINVTQFQAGEHCINVRSMDARGIWSVPETITYTKAAIPPPKRPTIKNLATTHTAKDAVTITAFTESEDGMKIAKAEWWIGEDPGRGKGNRMEGVFNSSRVGISSSADISRYEPGDYIINVRSLDERDIWSEPSGDIV